MFRRLVLQDRFAARSLHSPERLPTFTPVVLCLTAVLLGIIALANVAPVLLLAPVCFASCTLARRSIVVAASWLGVLLVALLVTPSDLFGTANLSLRSMSAVGIVALLSPWVRQWLLQQEWELVTLNTLAALTQDEKAANPEQSIAYALKTVRDVAEADAAIVLRQLDNVTAEALICLPETVLPNRLTTPTLFEEAIVQNRCCYYTDYAATPKAAPCFLAQGVQSAIVLPLQQPGNVQGAMLLLWQQPTKFSPNLKYYIESLQRGLGNLLRFQDLTLHLEKLQARLVAILETIPQGIVFIDESGDQGWLNQTAAIQLGLPQGFVEPIAIAQAMTALRQRASNSEELALQAAQFFSQPQVEIRDWQWRFSQPSQVLSLSSTPVHSRHVPGRLWVLTDITEHKQAEVALRQSEERFQLIVRATNDAVWDWDILSDRVWWNEGITTLFGYSPEEVGTTAAWWHDQIHPDDRSRVVSGIQAIITQNGRAWSDDYRFRCADGTYAYVFDRGYVVHAADGQPVRMLGGMTNVNDRKQAQEELERQNQRAQLFAEVTLKIRQSLQVEEILQTTVTEVQKIFNADRVLVYRLWPDGTGSGIAEAVLPELPSVVGHVFPEEVFPQEMRQLYFQGRIGSVSDVENDKEIAPCLVEYLHQFHVKAKLVVPIIAKEELWGLLVAHQCYQPRQWTGYETELLKQLADQIGIALTQAQLLEQETRQRQELARSNTELQQFAYIASHDLQEPLRMVTSYLQLLERRYKGKLDNSADDFIAFAVDGATRMKALINDLLTYSRVGTHGKSFERTDCTTVVKRAIANLKIAIDESEATINYAPLPEVQGDAIQLTQLFQNLISNAIKFHSEAPPVIQIRAELQAQEWLFSVQDNGIGIEPEYAEQIFVIFQRLHRRTDYTGTGIGLAVCKKIVERHGGRIWVQSELGQGATFYFTLPSLGDLNHEPECEPSY
jgi:PAS domain S-box-containing protein